MVKQHPECQNGSLEQPELSQKLPERGVSARAVRSGLDGGTRDGSLGVQSESDSDMLVDLLRQDYHGAGYLAFAKRLEETGLFDELERAGVLPAAPEPNPFDDELEGAQRRAGRRHKQVEIESEFSIIDIPKTDPQVLIKRKLRALPA